MAVSMNPLRPLAIGLATTAAIAYGFTPTALAQGSRIVVQGLQENQGLIRQCRRLNQTVEVFDNTRLGPIANRLGTLPAGTQVLLTGVVTEGRAQIFLGNNFNGLSSVQPMGWISASVLSPCSDRPPSTARACFRANVRLSVRATPATNANIIADYNAGDTIYASRNPPWRQNSGDGRAWLEVTIFDGSTGWVTETSSYGQVIDISAVPCP
ncbi:MULTISPECIES: SH3 domain-containing protein [Cyanophyceae]|uniref:SH3 domain-containing protein n=1 Tax=Cyanophyceae TaxID=3028117 RepID=UPI00168897C8|nr:MULTISPECIES: SH3 domain-containing protein [Cyanophyceae]MBD1915965.1 SH3 domain-containing protein [Phormidium sp. FACHB-77]MBD2030361.1 SH3 domain-containing protein [Phormidium sp. FACHB-322]MBD2053363.1 SH3 domain-containing protein [Leptolyngbya sp. FACHB-60]